MWNIQAAVAFLILLPALGARTRRVGSERFVVRIRSDLRQRIARGSRDADELRRVPERIDQITATGSS